MAGQITIGNVEIVAVLDMVPPPRDPWMMFPTTAEPDWADQQHALECGQLQLYYLHFFLRSEGKTIMVDTGMGPGPHPDRGKPHRRSGEPAAPEGRQPGGHRRCSPHPPSRRPRGLERGLHG